MAKEGFPGTTELRRQKPGQANGQEHRPRTQRSEVQAPVGPPQPDDKRQESNRQTRRKGRTGSKKLGNSSRFVRVILAQGPC